MYLDNYIPAIVDIDLWNKVQSLRKKKAVSRKDTIDDIFSGLLYCSECGLRLCKKVDRRSKNIVIRYVCDNSYRYKAGLDKKKCSNTKSIKESDVEKYLLNNVKQEIEDYMIRCMTDNKPKKAEDNTQKINTLNRKLNKLKELYINDLIDINSYKKDYQKYTTELNKISINQNEPVKDFTNMKQFLNLDIIKVYSKLSKIEKKKFWILLINKIYIKNGEIKEITFW